MLKGVKVDKRSQKHIKRLMAKIKNVYEKNY